MKLIEFNFDWENNKEYNKGINIIIAESILGLFGEDFL